MIAIRVWLKLKMTENFNFSRMFCFSCVKKSFEGNIKNIIENLKPWIYWLWPSPTPYHILTGFFFKTILCHFVKKKKNQSEYIHFLYSRSFNSFILFRLHKRRLGKFEILTVQCKIFFIIPPPLSLVKFRTSFMKSASINKLWYLTQTKFKILWMCWWFFQFCVSYSTMKNHKKHIQTGA